MAATQETKKESSNGAAEFARPPEGMRRIGSVTNAPWWKIEPGRALHGKLINVYERNDDKSPTKKSKFFQVELLAPANARLGRGVDAKPVTANAGEVVNVNYTAKTKDLEPLVLQVMRGAEVKIWLLPKGKIPVGKGQMWDIDVRADVGQLPAGVAEEADEDADLE